MMLRQEPLQSLASPMKHSIEVQARKSQIGANLLFGMLSDEVAQEDLSIALRLKLGEEPADDGCVLLVKETLERSRGRIGQRDRTLPFALRRPFGVFSTLGNEEVSGDLADVGRELGGLPQFSCADFLEDEPKRLLVEIISSRRVASEP